MKYDLLTLAPTVTGIISPDRQTFFSFAQDRNRGNQKHRLRQEIPCLCKATSSLFRTKLQAKYLYRGLQTSKEF